MKTVLPIQPKQHAHYDYTSIVGRPVRFDLEITYDTTVEMTNPFGVRIFYDTPSKPDDVPTDNDGGLPMDCCSYSENTAYFRMNDFLEDENITYSLEVILTHDTHQLTLETQLSGYIEFDTFLMLSVEHQDTSQHSKTESKHKR